jgi:type VI secretion system secreted protein VgrG
MSAFDLVTNAASQAPALLSSNVSAALSKFTAASRLYDLSGEGQIKELLVEGFVGKEALSELSETHLICVSTNAHLDLNAFLGQRIDLLTRLADGSRTTRSGLIRAAEQLGADGGLARYRFTVVPWLWFATQQQHHRVFQDKSVLEIVESLFKQYQQDQLSQVGAAWTIAPEVNSYLAQLTGSRKRSYCVQYRETDYAFISRLLAEEGLGFSVIHDSDGSKAWPAGHAIHLFADSAAFEEDYSSQHQNGGQGIRYHRAGSQEAQDAIQALGGLRQLQASSATVLSWDYKAKRAVAAHVPTHHRYGGKHAPQLESYDYAGLYAHADVSEATRYAELHLQASEARNKTYLGRSTVRTFAACTCFDLTQGTLSTISTLDAQSDTNDSNKRSPAEQNRLSLLSVSHVGINNLPKEASHAIAQLLGESKALLEQSARQLKLAPSPSGRGQGEGGAFTQSDFTPVLTQAAQSGYANAFTAIRSYVPWRPLLGDGTGMRANPKPTAHGLHSALVVGPNGDKNSHEIYCDALGRIKVQFHWQGEANTSAHTQTPDNALTCWVRVAQQQAGPGMGWQLLPRIGQEVLVTFMDGDIDRPLVVAGSYNGQGEGGTVPTPGSQAQAATQAANLTVFDGASDHRLSAQGNLVSGAASGAGGQGSHSPAWHGASSADVSVDNSGGQHNNAAALTGFKSKEFQGNGFNQLVLDDTPQQQRVQLASTSNASQLNLGHLLHQSDNYRGSFRGQGAELRTDAYGAVRSGQGLLISSYASPQSHPSQAAGNAGDNAPGIALLKQALTLGQTFSQAASTHHTVKLASTEGSTKANQSAIDDKHAPLKALLLAASGMVDSASVEAALSDATDKNTKTSSEGSDSHNDTNSDTGNRSNGKSANNARKVPHTTDPIITISAKAGLGLIAGQALQFNTGQTLSLGSGLDSNTAVAGQSRTHSGQALGILAGAIKPGEGNTGLSLIAAQDPIELQAQSDTLKVQSKAQTQLISVSSNVDFAAAKKIRLATAAGASITIEGGAITVQCPGQITVHAAQKSFTGPTNQNYPMPQLPKGTLAFDEKFQLVDSVGDPVGNMRYEITKPNGAKIQGFSDAQGNIPLQAGFSPEQLKIKILGKVSKG